MYDFITFGSATRDVFMRSPALETHPSDHSASGVDCCFPLGAKIEISELVFETGGGATNSAATFSRLGHKAAAAVCIGDDLSGRDILDVLKANGIDTSFVQTHSREQTAFSLITLVGSGERTILVYRGAAENLDRALIPWTKAKAKWFYVSSLAGQMKLNRDIFEHAERIGAKVAWNPGSRELKRGLDELGPLIKKVDILNLNFEEAMKLVNTTSRNLSGILNVLRGLPKRAVVITDGQNGAYADDGQRTWHSDVLDVPRVNVTGAGDGFGSGLVAGLFKEDQLTYALAVGTLNASGIVQITGAKRGILDSYPTDKEIESVKVEEWKG